MENNSIPKFLPEEWFEQSEHKFEYVGLIHDVNVFYSKRHTILERKENVVSFGNKLNTGEILVPKLLFKLY